MNAGTPREGELMIDGSCASNDLLYNMRSLVFIIASTAEMASSFVWYETTIVDAEATSVLPRDTACQRLECSNRTRVHLGARC